MHFVGVFNRDGGTFRTTDMEAFCARAGDILAAHGHTLDCRPVAGANIAAALEQAAADAGEGVLLAGGGDGTISTAAEIAFRTGVVLAVLPAGTMNLFARALKLPQDLEGALEALAGGEVKAVDIATANGKCFVHQFGVGIHARLVRIRDELTYRSRFGKMLASVRAVGGAIVNPPRFAVEIETAAGREQRVASGIAVSNNPAGEGHIPYADALDQGLLGVYIAKPMSSWALLRLLVRVLVGRWRNHPAVLEKEVTELTLMFPRRKRSAQAVIDGELIELEPRVAIKVHPGALQVLAPVFPL
jgi:diacylglycerol kinase family enzyme